MGEIERLPRNVNNFVLVRVISKVVSGWLEARTPLVSRKNFCKCHFHETFNASNCNIHFLYIYRILIISLILMIRNLPPKPLKSLQNILAKIGFLLAPLQLHISDNLRMRCNKSGSKQVKTNLYEDTYILKLRIISHIL